jgi:hypothetical protein
MKVLGVLYIGWLHTIDLSIYFSMSELPTGIDGSLAWYSGKRRNCVTAACALHQQTA